jgi:cation:H+ antiporter
VARPNVACGLAFTTGATLVAFGTSVPELATTLLAARRGHDDVSVGTLLGSNLFNGLFVVGVAGAIQPARPALPEVAAGLAFGALTTLLMTPASGTFLSRARGAALLLCYGAYVTLILSAGGR